MTAKKDLKRRIRERMERTGESYVVARRAVMAEGDALDMPPGFPSPSLREAVTIVPELQPASDKPFEVVEMIDFTEQAATLGLRCTVSLTTQLTDRVEPLVVLTRFRDILYATSGDPAMEPMRAVALRGEAVTRNREIANWWEAMKHFTARVGAGIGGVSEGGTMLAVPIAGNDGLVMMVAQLGFGIVQPRRHPSVVISTADVVGFYIEPIAVRALRR